MAKSRFKKLKNKNGWLYALLIIIVIVIIGYAFFPAEQKKKIEVSPKIINDTLELEKERSSLLKKINRVEDQLLLLISLRIKKLIVARVLLIIGIILINLSYYHFIVPQSEKHGFMVDHFSDCTSFILLVYSAIAFVSSGTVKVFSQKIHNALFKTVFEEEQKLIDEKERLFSELSSISDKLKTIKTI